MPRKPNGKRVVTIDGQISVRAKNANGEGSVFFAESEGSWRASYVLAGETKRRYAQARTREQVVAKRDLAIANAAAGRPAVTRFSDRTTIGELTVAWLSTVARHRMRSSTLDETAKRLGRLGELRSLPISDLTTETLTAWQSRLLDRLAPITVVGTRKSVAQVLNWAVELGVIDKNPIIKVRPAKVVPKTGFVLSVDDVARLLAATETHRYGPVVALLFTSGLRVSEALGLSWDDVDLDEATAMVRRCATYTVSTGKSLGPPKTKGALGQHFLAPGTVTKLRTWKERQAAERLGVGALWPTHVYDGQRIDLVFTAPNGDLVSRQHIDTLLRRVGGDIGLDASRLGTHTGRRSLITALYTNGVALDDIQHHIGHSDSRTTAGYVASLGNRPRQTAAIAAHLMDRRPVDSVVPIPTNGVKTDG